MPVKICKENLDKKLWGNLHLYNWSKGIRNVGDFLNTTKNSKYNY